MGQYHKFVNLTKKEFIDPHVLGDGLKAWEILANGGCGKALVVLMCCPDRRGGGDLEEGEYVGRWHGDHVVMVGDYAEPEDHPLAAEAHKVWDEGSGYYDVSLGVAAVIERELEGKFVGDGWRSWQPNEETEA